MDNLKRTPNERLREFKILLDIFCGIAGESGVYVRPYDAGSPAHFARLPDAQQDAVMKNFRQYLDVCLETRAAGHSLRDDKVLTWRMLQRVKCHAPSDFFNEFREGELIEVYDTSFIQIFRNLKFFEICSYSLDELLSRPFWELISREESIGQRIFEQASRLLTGEVTGMLKFEVPRHEINETSSLYRNRITIRQRVGATLRDSQGKPSALVAFLELHDWVSTSLKPGADSDE